jgi:hypothetical protein
MEGNCVHILEDSFAAITVRRLAPYSEDVEVDSVHITNVAPHAPNLFINIEMDDAGVIEPADCDCTLSRLGFRRRLNHLAAFGKMSPQGMTFLGTDLVQVLEEVLPASLGGRAGHYQLVECEAASRQTQLRLHVSPRAGVTDMKRVTDVFMKHMRRRWGGAVATRAWRHSAGVEAVLAEPLVTRTGKVHPIRLLAASPASGQPAVRSAHAT